MMPRSFISADGRIVSHRRLPSFNIGRLIVVFLLVLICIVTNPSNKLVVKNGRLFTSSSPSSLAKTAPIIRQKNFLSSWNTFWKNIMRQFSSVNEIKYTNYILFSIRRRGSGIELVLLSKTIPICTFNGEYSNICKSIANTVVHDKKMFDKSYLPYTIIRLVAILKMINWIFTFCLLDRSHTSPNILQRIFFSKFTSPLLSILNSDKLWLDLILLNTIMYKSLLSLEKIVVRLGPPFQDSTNNVSIHAFLLIFILGGLSNFVAEYMTGRPVIEQGMNASVATCLGYSLQVAPHTPLLRVFDVDLTPGEILSYVFITFLTHAWIDSRSGNRTSSSRILTWIIGAFLGIAFYEFQLQIYSSRFQ